MSSAHLHRHNSYLLILWRCSRKKSVFVTLLSAAGLWMTAAAWRSVPRASSGQVAGVTCVTTPVPPVWMQELPTVPAVTPVRPERARYCIYCLFACLCTAFTTKCALICRIFKDLLKLDDRLLSSYQEKSLSICFLFMCVKFSIRNAPDKQETVESSTSHTNIYSMAVSDLVSTHSWWNIPLFSFNCSALFTRCWMTSCCLPFGAGKLKKPKFSQSSTSPPLFTPRFFCFSSR